MTMEVVPVKFFHDVQLRKSYVSHLLQLPQLPRLLDQAHDTEQLHSVPDPKRQEFYFFQGLVSCSSVQLHSQKSSGNYQQAEVDFIAYFVDEVGIRKEAYDAVQLWEYMSARRRPMIVSYRGRVGTGSERSKIVMSDRDNSICRKVKQRQQRVVLISRHKECYYSIQYMVVNHTTNQFHHRLAANAKYGWMLSLFELRAHAGKVKNHNIRMIVIMGNREVFGIIVFSAMDHIIVL